MVSFRTSLPTEEDVPAEIHTFTRNISEDIKLLTQNKNRFDFRNPLTISDYWRLVRWACRDTQDIDREALCGIKPDDLGTDLGKLALALFSNPNFNLEPKPTKPAKISCTSAEKYFINTAAWPAVDKTLYPPPVLLSDKGGEIAGIVKFYRMPSVLGLTDIPEQGLYPGIISAPVKKSLSDALLSIANINENGPKVVGLEDIAPADGAFEGQRLSNFVIDKEILALFARYLGKPVMSLEGMRQITYDIERASGTNRITRSMARNALVVNGINPDSRSDGYQQEVNSWLM